MCYNIIYRVYILFYLDLCILLPTHYYWLWYIEQELYIQLNQLNYIMYGKIYLFDLGY